MMGASRIHDAAADFIKSCKEQYEANMSWLAEVHEEASRIRNCPQVWLPRTPGTKKTKRTFAHVASWNQESTFHEGSEKKKLKIDEISTINDNSMMETDTSINNTTRALRPRQQRQAKGTMPRKQPKRNAKKVDSQNKVESIVTKQAFIPPATIETICMNGTSNDSTLKINNANSNRKPQSKAQDGARLFKKVEFGDTIIKNTDSLFKDACLEEKNSDTIIKNSDSLFKDACLEEKNEVQEQKSLPDSGRILSKNSVLNDSNVEDQSIVEHSLPVPVTVNDTIDGDPDASVEPVSSSTPDVKGKKEVEVIEASPLDAPDGSPVECSVSPEGEECSPVQCFIKYDGTDSNHQDALTTIVPTEEAERDSERSPGEVPCYSGDLTEKDNVVDSSDVGRRGTYKIMVNSIIDAPHKKPSPESDKNALPSIMTNACDTGSGNRMGKDAKKIPKIVKPNRGGNIVSNIKTFIKRPESPKQVEFDEAKKGLAKQKTIEEIQKKKQMQMEERKRQQEEREKRFAEQQKRIQEEEEAKRKLLKLKAAQIEKNQEEIRKMREQEQKKKKELRENKKAELDARRQKEEEEKERKALELLQDEKRKEEILQRKAELEEQKRKAEKAEKEMLGKEKLRKLEQNKVHDEDRLKREFEEKERHRLEVEKKKKEEKENERLERQQREERQKQAEKEIADAKKQEEERIKREQERVKREEERARREEIRKKREAERIKMMQEAKEKAKALAKERNVILNKPVNAADGLRSSPRLKAQNNCPEVPLVQRDSTAFVNYGLDDFDSGDSTDDDTRPSKPVPSWAMGSRLNKQLMRQFYTDIEPDNIFVNAMQPLRLEIIFNKSKTRYFKRTSSAHWSSPPIKSIFKPRQ